MTNDQTCRVCSRVHGVDGWNPRHQPVLGDNPTGTLPQKDKPRPDVTPGVAAAISAWPFDPVLRQALMDAGIITPQMLRDAEEKIRAVTANLTAPLSGVEVRDGAD
jgi:hypothetical protein